MNPVFLGADSTPLVSPGGILLEMAGVLVLLLGAFVVLVRLRRRFLHGGGGRLRRLQIVETVPIGPRRTLVLVRVGGVLRLLASSEAGIADLGSVPDADVDALFGEKEIEA